MFHLRISSANTDRRQTHCIKRLFLLSGFNCICYKDSFCCLRVFLLHLCSHVLSSRSVLPWVAQRDGKNYFEQSCFIPTTVCTCRMSNLYRTSLRMTFLIQEDAHPSFVSKIEDFISWVFICCWGSGKIGTKNVFLYLYNVFRRFEAFNEKALVPQQFLPTVFPEDWDYNGTTRSLHTIKSAHSFNSSYGQPLHYNLTLQTENKNKGNIFHTLQSNT